jgi:uncharacterized protein (TIGR00255 family)
MLKSMTGFGKEVIETPFRKVTVEIRTLNSKQLDLNLRTPLEFREKEPEIRSLISKSLQRGKIDFNIQTESIGNQTAPVINKELAKHYYDEMVLLAETVGQTDYSGFLPVIVKMPDVFVQNQKETNPEEWEQIKSGIIEAIKHVDQFRMEEGAILEKDLIQRINLIADLLEEVIPYEAERPAIVKERIRKRLEEWAADADADSNRLEQEMIYYLEKFDITEEKVRLKKHCDYFLETLKSPQSPGKKLGFVTQEIGREINTLGSKANHAEIQKIVVLMKDELEKVKEQLFNIL